MEKQSDFVRFQYRGGPESMATKKKDSTTSVPRELATTTDLPAKDVRTVTEALNPLVADAFALYVKTKNFHWHLSGARFRDLHLLFDEQAEAILASIDPLAERVRKIGGTTVRSIAQIGTLQTIKDDDETFVKPDQMVRRLMEDNKAIAASMREAHTACDATDDVATTSLLEDLIDETERRTWFLFEVLQDTDRFA